MVELVDRFVDRMLYALDDGSLVGDEELIGKTLLDVYKEPGLFSMQPRQFVSKVNERLFNEHSKYRFDGGDIGSGNRFGSPPFAGELRLMIRGKDEPIERIQIIAG